MQILMSLCLLFYLGNSKHFMLKAQDKNQTNLLDVKMLREYLKYLEGGEFPLNGVYFRDKC